MIEGLRLLIIDDEEVDRLAVERYLRGAGETRMAATGTEGQEIAEEWRPDCVLLDYRLPDGEGTEFLPAFQRLGLPVVLVTGMDDLSVAEKALKRGAEDYIVKSDLSRDGLNRSIRHAVQRHRSRAELQQTLEALPVGVLLASADGVILRANHTAAEIFERPVGELLGSTLDSLAPSEWDDTADRMVLERSDGSESELEVRWTDVEVEGREGVLVTLTDVTSQRELQKQLEAVQRLESVGKLAGGVAHDFNNLLTAILSFSAFIAEEVEVGSQIHDDIQEVIGAAERGADLTKQMLAFSRQQPVEPKVSDANELLTEMGRLLEQVFPADSEFEFELAEGLWETVIDPGAFHQVLVNLCVNARDAMPNGGRCTVTTANLWIDGGLAKETNLPPGEYIRVAVADTGTGIPEHVMERIFEPFYTTKGVGKGTGLGLSTCYGLISQAEGVLRVESVEGEGTTFEILLPRFREGKEEARKRIVVADDNDRVLALAQRSLENAGFAVIVASDGAEALELVKESRPDLVLTDIVMPHMLGPELAVEVAALYPDLPVVFMSGYSEMSDGSHPEVPEGRLLEKPFTPASLVAWVKEALEPQGAEA